MSDMRSLLNKMNELNVDDNFVHLHDSFDIEINESFVIETGVIGFTKDGIILEADEKTLEFLDVNDIILESEEVDEGLKDPKDNPCWKGYKPVGTKKKNGRTVPNCVPKESVAEERTEVKDKDGNVISWRDEGKWKKVSDKDPRGKVTNLSDRARRETEKMKKGVKEGKQDEEDEGNPVMNALIRRTMATRPDLLKHGPERLLAAIRDVADGVGEVQEIGTSDISAWMKRVEQHLNQQGVAEGITGDDRDRLDDLISMYRDSVDPNDYYDRDVDDPEEVIAMIRREFGDKIAKQVEAGADKMHFPRAGHTQGYDPMSWRKPIDRQTKAGKMYKQDSDFRKNTIKSRYKLSGKSSTHRTDVNLPEEGVAEGYILKKTNVSKHMEPGDPDEYTQDVNIKDTDYEIINNKTGQVVGTASWTTNDFMGPGALKITMKNGATRYLDIWDRERGNPQSAFNRFVKDPKTAKKYKDEQGVAEGYKVVRDIDRERYQERPGLEGPFQTKSGKVVYYDPKEGMYYDPDSDMYIEHDDWMAMNEAEYQGRNVPLGKPMAGDVKKSKVYVRKPNGKVVKVNFGDKNMRIKKSNPNRRKSFRARHRCENPGPRWKARYWSCRSW